LQHGLVQAQLGHQLLKARVFIGQLLEFARLVRFQTGIFLLPAIKSLFRDAGLADEVGDRQPSSACFTTATICSTEKRFLFMAPIPPSLRGKVPSN
jgi:hypothetical protein